MTEIAPLCRGCGYDLTGLEAPGLCPECGTRFDELPSDEIVTLAWPCLNCGYPLAGFRRSQRCSECATPVRISVDPTLLRFQSLEFRNRLRRGALFAGLGLVLLILVPAIGAILAFILQSDEMFGALVVAGYLAMAALFLIGCCMLLTTPPDSLGLSSKEARRWPLARWALIGWLVTSVLAIGVSQAVALFYGSAALSALAEFTVIALQILAAVASLAFFILGLRVLHAIYARARTARKRPGKIVTFTLWAGICVAVLYLVSGALFVLSAAAIATSGSAGATAGAGAMLFAIFPMGLAGIGLFIVYICSIASLEGIRSSVKRVNREILLAHKRATAPAPTGETPTPASPNNTQP